MTYLTDEQITQLLKPINPKRVGTDGKRYAHVEAYEIRAHLNRSFGFARWSADVLSQELIFETADERTKKNSTDKYTAWTVCYRTLLRLTVCAPDGTVLATYTEGATGSGTAQPQRDDAHDLALKTSESQALKRCAFNLGDQFGLSLFNKGSKNALVLRTLIGQSLNKAADDATGGDITAHITEPLATEDTAPDSTADPRSTSSVPSGPHEETRGSLGGQTPDGTDLAHEIRDQLIEGPLDHDPRKWIQDLTRKATAGGALKAQVADENGVFVSLKVLIENSLKRVAA